jgi:hypothetical protein
VSLPVPCEWLRQLRPGDVLRLTDTRGAERTLRVVAVDPDGCWVESRKTCYVEPETVLCIEDGASESAIKLSTGDELIVTRADITGHGAVRDDQGGLLIPAMIGCTADRVFEDVQAGDRIWFDDGKLSGVVRHIGRYCPPDARPPGQEDRHAPCPTSRHAVPPRTGDSYDRKLIQGANRRRARRLLSAPLSTGADEHVNLWTNSKIDTRVRYLTPSEAEAWKSATIKYFTRRQVATSSRIVAHLLFAHALRRLRANSGVRPDEFSKDFESLVDGGFATDGSSATVLRQLTKSSGEKR